MSEKVIWLLAFVALYWACCVYWGVRGAMEARSASDYFIAGRRIPAVVLILSMTGALVAGWTFIGHPGLIHRDGFPYAYASLFAVAAPLMGVMILKRQWMLGKRFGYVTPGEMLSDYFQGSAIQILTALVALVFSIAYLGMLFGASGSLLSALTDGHFDAHTGLWMAAAALFLYVALGGLRAVAYAGVLQCVLYAFGMLVIGIIALDAAGGWEVLNAALAKLAASDTGRWGTTGGWGGGDYNAYFALPGVIQPASGVDAEMPVGGPWTGVMCMTFVFALAGIQSAPAFSMMTFASEDEKAFAPQQVVAMGFCIGLILVCFAAFQGIGALAQGGGVASKTDVATGPMAMAAAAVMQPDVFVLAYLDSIAESAPWLFGVLAVCGLAALQTTAAVLMSTGGAILTRDLYKRFAGPAADHKTQIQIGRIAVLIITVAALIPAMLGSDSLVLFGGLAVAFGAQMLPSLVAITWAPWITRQGATLGLAAGLLAVILTDALGARVAGELGLDLPWGRYPLTIHSAGWGIMANLAVCILVSAATRNAAARDRRMIYHDFLLQHAGLPTNRKRLVPVAWTAALLWVFFGIGPGAVIGNDIFGAPDAGVDGWVFGIPSIWAWQILFWLLGVAMLWFLAYKMALSTAVHGTVDALVDDSGDVPASSGTR